MSKSVIRVSAFCLLASLVVVECSPVPSAPMPIAYFIERDQGPIVQMVPILPEAEVQVPEETDPVRSQRSLKSHHHHHGGHHQYRPQGQYGGGNPYYGNGGGSYAGASAFSGSQGGYGGHGSGASASSNSFSFQTPFGGVSGSQAQSYSNSYGRGGRGRDRYTW